MHCSWQRQFQRPESPKRTPLMSETEVASASPRRGSDAKTDENRGLLSISLLSKPEKLIFRAFFKVSWPKGRKMAVIAERGRKNGPRRHCRGPAGNPPSKRRKPVALWAISPVFKKSWLVTPLSPWVLERFRAKPGELNERGRKSNFGRLRMTVLII